MELPEHIKELAKQVHPMEVESFDGRFNVACVDENMLELTMTMLDMSHKWYRNEDEDWVQKIQFGYADIDRLIEILQEAKKINTVSWNTILDKYNKNQEKQIHPQSYKHKFCRECDGELNTEDDSMDDLANGYCYHCAIHRRG